MSKFTIDIDCDNDAFTVNATPEVNLILRRLTDRLYLDPENDSAGPLLDSNGNHVGHWSWEP